MVKMVAAIHHQKRSVILTFNCCFLPRHPADFSPLLSATFFSRTHTTSFKVSLCTCFVIHFGSDLDAINRQIMNKTEMRIGTLPMWSTGQLLWLIYRGRDIWWLQFSTRRWRPQIDQESDGRAPNLIAQLRSVDSNQHTLTLTRMRYPCTILVCTVCKRSSREKFCCQLVTESFSTLVWQWNWVCCFFS